MLDGLDESGSQELFHLYFDFSLNFQVEIPSLLYNELGPGLDIQ